MKHVFNVKSFSFFLTKFDYFWNIKCQTGTFLQGLPSVRKVISVFSLGTSNCPTLVSSLPMKANHICEILCVEPKNMRFLLTIGILFCYF